MAICQLMPVFHDQSVLQWPACFPIYASWWGVHQHLQPTHAHGVFGHESVSWQFVWQTFMGTLQSIGIVSQSSHLPVCFLKCFGVGDRQSTTCHENSHGRPATSSKQSGAFGWAPASEGQGSFEHATNETHSSKCYRQSPTFREFSNGQILLVVQGQSGSYSC